MIFLSLLSTLLLNALDVKVDSKTNLMWQDDRNSKYIKKNWKDAVTLCSQLRLSGYDDWKLPTIKELETIIDLSEDQNAMKRRFKHIGGSGYYWSSDEGDNKEFAWMMNFKRGYEYINYKTYERFVRCVRNNSSDK
ncbi:MAG: Unknown protein [uncultured Sulfurovum sp.]|uniref:Lcl C-terminal domain-containing protein n=1 Tax=uncultured Sulfurovum sp. TaxID=269237 RepID=A0A6S6UCI2_9BACT|nr:MAG: Unknown protein [uncultured Sulfurovum sp.]